MGYVIPAPIEFKFPQSSEVVRAEHTLKAFNPTKKQGLCTEEKTEK